MKPASYILTKSFVTKAIILTIALLGAWPRISSAQCRQWEIVRPGVWNWQWRQNDDIEVTLINVRQQGKSFTATATYSSPNSVGSPNSGNVHGLIDGAVFTAKVFWNSRDVSVYSGQISPEGKVDGSIVIEKGKHVSKHLTFQSVQRLICASAESAPPRPTPPPYTKPATTPAGPGETSTSTSKSKTPPYITGSPSVVQIPQGQTEGTATLTWDAGPDHPYAEVWVKEGGNDPKKLFESPGTGKGTLKVKVRAGTGSKAYSYILSDAGTDLANVLIMGSR